MNMNPLQSIESSTEKVVNKLSAYSQSHYTSIDQLIKQVDTLNQQLLQDSTESDLTVTGVMLWEQQIKKLKDALNKTSAEHRDIHTSVSKIGKEIDKVLVPDLSGVCRKEEHYEHRASKRARINSLIAERLLSQGLIDVTDKLEQESGISLNGKNRDKFQVVNNVIESLKARDLSLAMAWCVEYRDELQKINSDLEYNLLRLKFVQLLEQNASRQEALEAAKLLQPYAAKHQEDIQTLMGALLYSKDGLKNSRYGYLCSQMLWIDMSDQFARDACSVLKLPIDNPLTTILNAGCRAVPQLLKLRDAFQARQVPPIWSHHADELPIEIDLGADQQKLAYHSVFTCPILRQQTTEHNPPMRLACGHVISKDALNKLASAHRLKCPYCPTESLATEAKQVFF